MHPKTRIQRLLDLAHVLRTRATTETFDMGTFFWDPARGEAFYKPGDCGTYACIAGWATVSNPDLELGYDGTGTVVHKTIKSKGSRAFRDAFGLTDQEARRLVFEWPDRPGMDHDNIAAADRVEALAKEYADRDGYGIIE